MVILLFIVFQIEELMIIFASEVLLECEMFHDIPYATICNDIISMDRDRELTSERMSDLLHRDRLFYHESRPDLSDSQDNPLESDDSRVRIHHLTDVILCLRLLRDCESPHIRREVCREKTH